MILVDPRAGSNELVQHPPLDDPSTATLERLESGDAAFDGKGPKGLAWVGVEVKKVPDLLSSISTGRLQDKQIRGMLHDYDERWLLIVGQHRPGVDGMLQYMKKAKGQPARWARYQGGGRDYLYARLEAFLLTLQHAGVRVMRVATNREAAHWIGCLHSWWQKPWTEHRSLQAHDMSQTVGAGGLVPDGDPHLRQVAKTLSTLPGLGGKRALAAARHFGSIGRAIEADAGKWAEVEGIGRGIGRGIEEAVR